MRSLPEVMPVGEAREALSQVLAVFRREGRDARPVFFGSRRQAEAVIIPVELFEALVPLMEDLLIRREVQARLADHDGTTWLDFDSLVKESGFDPADHDLD